MDDGLLGAFALHHLGGQAIVGLAERQRSLVDSVFKMGVERGELASHGLALNEQFTSLVLAPSRADCGQRGAGEGLGAQRSFEQHHVS